MAWPSTPPDLIALFERSLPLDPRVDRRKMFRCPCAFANGAMFMGVHAGTLFLRLDPTDRARAIAEHGARLFDPMGGRPMREYVVVPATILQKAETRADWIARGFAYALTVPAKPKRVSKRN